MKKTITAALLAAAAAVAVAAGPAIEPDKLGAELAPIREKAKAGDYQAQRNLAYSYATGASDLKGAKYPVAACAWYMSIPYTNGARFDFGDSSNIYTHCRNLSPDAYEKAIRYSMELVAAGRSADPPRRGGDVVGSRPRLPAPPQGGKTLYSFVSRARHIAAMPADERLTPHFFLSQLTASPMAGRAGLRNSPRGHQIENLRRLAQTLEGLSTSLNGAPICVLRAFRHQPVLSPGSMDEPAADGRSVDFIAPEFGTPREICLHLVGNGVAFDRLVNCGDWIQLDIPKAGREPRRAVQTGAFEFAHPMRFLEGLV